ncbi:hypothetical protein PR048_016360 [Dryococelus australis]|uniref:Reverse transcriptase domain-containing protein n=1 Tax=Dryococelus australis TaxID=614101 RepID=A0ABQ9HJI2_9NEOP|nr:hypothetical protein PR048_016360 [Dryococelus australis]
MFLMMVSDKQVRKCVIMFPQLFDGGLGKFSKKVVTLELKYNITKVFYDHIECCYSLLKTKLLRLYIIHPVVFTDWAMPIVPVIKSNGRVRICVFSKIDLSQAYQQLQFDETSQEICTITTHKILFRYKHLPFGVTSASAIHQSTMDQVLQGLEYIVSFRYDILVTGKDAEDHLKNLEQSSIVNKDKYQFFLRSILLLGHVVDQNGISTQTKKVEAVENPPKPLNVLHKSLPCIAMVMAPLYALIKEDCKWNCSVECDDAFATVFSHYEPDLHSLDSLRCITIWFGGSNLYPSGDEIPIAFASCTLTKAQQNYSQIDREELAIMCGVKRFSDCFYGRHFTLITDHKPILYILLGTQRHSADGSQ